MHPLKHLKIYLVILILLFAGTGIWAYVLINPVPSDRRLSVETVIGMLNTPEKDRYQLVDVRESWENQAVRIPGSRHIPLKKITNEAKQLDRYSTLILYCTVGVRSDKAYSIFRDMGFNDIYVVEGGLEAWMDQRGPLETPSIPQWIEGRGCES